MRWQRSASYRGLKIRRSRRLLTRPSKSLLQHRRSTMKRLYPLAIALFIFASTPFIFAREAKLVRYPSYHNGRVAFTYLADIWVADETGQNVQRLTVNRARD